MQMTGRRALARIIGLFDRGRREEPHPQEPALPIRGHIDRFDCDECAGWALDSTDLSKPLTVQVIIDGVIAHTEVANLERRDLIPFFGSANHGFSMGISRYLKKGANTVELVVAEGGFAFADSIRMIDAGDLSSLVEPGEDGFLFLCNDTNRTSDMIEGRRPLPPETARALAESLIRRQRMMSALGARCVTMIVPEKSVICNSKRAAPLRLSDARPAIQLRDVLAGEPLDVYEYATGFFDAFSDPAEAFLKTDTHLSSGARHALFRYVMNRLGLVPATGHEVSAPEQFSGDLGLKLDPPRSETVVNHRPLFETRKLVDEATPAIIDGTTRRGTRIYHESAADNDLACVLIGTSTAYFMREWFYANFRRLHFYWGNGVDHGFLRAARPDYVVCIASERYIGSSLEDKEIGLRPVVEAAESL